MAAVVHFLMRRRLALVENRQENLQRRRARRRRPHILKPRVTLFGMLEDAVVWRYCVTQQVILDLIVEFLLFVTRLTVVLVTLTALTFSTIEDQTASFGSITDIG
ncbi:UNVERIFIED_CONTAM: hypothetical protein FKN15_058754 [Acipenser sinensis]